MPDECIFCKIADLELPVELLYEDEVLVAFKDIHPVAPVHILIVPRKHQPNILELTDVDADTLGKVFEVAAKLAREHDIAESGFRIVLNTGPDSGQIVQHIHFHLLGGRPLAWPPG